MPRPPVRNWDNIGLGLVQPDIGERGSFQKKIMVRSAGQLLAGEGVRGGDNNQEGIWCSQHSLLYFFSFLSCTFPGKDKGLKNTLKRVMKFLRVLCTNLPWDIRGAWEKTQRCL